MATAKDFIVKNGLQVNGNVSFTGTLTGDGSGLTGAGVSDYNLLTNKPTTLSAFLNDNGFATESYVTTQINNLVNGAPGQLDTLNELASALGNDSNYASSITSLLGSKADTSSLAAVATSGNYNDLSNIPNVPNLESIYSNILPGPTNLYNLGSSTRRWAGIYIGSTNGINLQGPITTWGLTGADGDVIRKDNGLVVWGQLSYNSLSDKPTIPASQIASDWNQTNTGAVDFIKNKPTIPNLASVTELTPWMDGAVTIGSTTKYFSNFYINNITLNSTYGRILLNGTNGTAGQVLTSGGASATPTWTSLATVATSGSYNDLSNKPTIPTNTNQLTNGAGFITGITSTNVTTALGFTPIQLSSLSIAATAPAAGSGALAYNNTTGVFTYTPPAISTLLATGTSAIDVQFDSLGIGVAFSGVTGEIRAGNNITAYYSSDARLKENIQDVDSALDKVCAIGSKTFDWTDKYIETHGGEDGYFIQKSDFGVIAQDVQEVFPQAVRTREDGTLAVDYEKLSTLAFGAIKELVKRIEALEAK